MKEKKSKQIHVFMEPALHEKVREVAELEGTNVSLVMRTLARLYLQDYKKREGYSDTLKE